MPRRVESSSPGHGPISVLQLIGNLDIGGAQEVVVTLATALQTSGHRPVVCTLRDGPLRAELEARDVPVVFVADRRHSVVALPLFLADLWRIRRELRTVVADNGIDVIQTHLLRAIDFVVATLRDRTGRPLVYWTFHNFNFELRREHLPRFRWLLGPKRLAHRLLYRWGSRSIDGLIAVSDEVRTSILASIGPVDDKIVVVPNGVDVDRYDRLGGRDAVRTELDVPDEAVVFTVVATFKTQKGHVHLVDAVARLTADHPELRVLLVGDGELMDEIRRQVHAASLDHVVLFLGSRRDVPEILSASDAFVLPSLWEGLPMALLEAMASGLPCIATTVSGTRQVIRPGETGLLVPPGDVDALRGAMSQILTDREQARAMGAAGRERVERHFSALAQAQNLVARFEADRASSRQAPDRRATVHRRGERGAH